MERIITWFVDNPVAANLMMAIFVAGGLLSLASMHQEEFPNIDLDIIRIQVPYLGAAPEEVEQAVCIRIEEAIEGIQGIDKINTISTEGSCIAIIELDGETDSTRTLNEIKAKIDAITTFPKETEKPLVSMLEFKGQVIHVAVSGNSDDLSLKALGERIRDDLAAMDGISQVVLNYARPYEISIEVSEYTLRQYNLTLDKVAQAIRRSSLDLPGGSIKSDGGEILLRSKGQAYRGHEYESIVIISRPDGTSLTLGEIATVRDEFQEGYLNAIFDGDNAVMVTVYRVGNEDIIKAADRVKKYVADLQNNLPRGIILSVWIDESEALKHRINALTKNAYAGLIMVFIILTVFLRFKVAVWVAAGIPIAILGAIWMFPAAGINISSLTVMAFILVLGIVVDDAIVVGERVFAHEANAESKRHAAISGTYEVSVPVIFGVLTSMAAFLPILIVDGRMGAFFQVIGWVVIVCLIFSLLESQLILPAHLAHRKTRGYMFENTRLVKSWITIQGRFSDGLAHVANEIYKPMLMKSLEWRWLTWSIAMAVLIIALALILSGRVIFQFFPAVEGDRVYATLIMPEGVKVDLTERGIKQIEDAAAELGKQLDQETGIQNGHVIKHVLASIGVNAARSNGPPRFGAGGSHLAEVVLELVPIEERPGISSTEITNRWRDLSGVITDAVELTFSSNTFSAGAALRFELQGRDVDQLRLAAADLRERLSLYPGVMDLTDSFRAGKQEAKLSILPEAIPLGLTLNDLARQVRQAFYGEEAQRIQRGTDDVRVMVRYPEAERKSLGNLEDMRIRTKDGTEVPFSTVAAVTLGNGYSSIQRQDQRRVVSVIGDVNRTIIAPEELFAAINKTFCENGSSLSNVENQCTNSQFPSVTYSLGGEARERNKAMTSLFNTVPLALMIIFALLAIPLKSYMQPLVIMMVIPFGAVGAIVGHFIMGWNLVFFSLLGIIALSGVVVNASLVLVDYINRRRRAGVDVFEAVTTAGVVRFRPIILTSATTFMGLIPLMTDKDPQTFMFIPMAISLAFGILFSTVITLFLVPSLYLMLEDWLKLLGMSEGSDDYDQDPVPMLTDMDPDTEPQAE
ncbi:MAG: efflux RND transporter permease subunit [Gammaproteobacteria bacterium]|nr:efflux RND transporter permease subunit [Gammaproteobacteria bacterium]